MNNQENMNGVVKAEVAFISEVLYAFTYGKYAYVMLRTPKDLTYPGIKTKWYELPLVQESVELSTKTKPSAAYDKQEFTATMKIAFTSDMKLLKPRLKQEKVILRYKDAQGVWWLAGTLCEPLTAKVSLLKQDDPTSLRGWRLTITGVCNDVPRPIE
jgi:hypothetical protein